MGNPRKKDIWFGNIDRKQMKKAQIKQVCTRMTEIWPGWEREKRET